MIRKVSVWCGAALLLAGGLACGDEGPSPAFCDAYDSFVAASQALQLAPNADNVAATRAAVVKMRDEAPEDIKDDLASFLATLDKAVEADDPSLLQSEENTAVAGRIDEVAGEC